MGSDVAGRRPVLDVYARLSRAYKGETIQVDDQVEVCLEELAERGDDAGEVFKDNRVISSRRWANRPESFRASTHRSGAPTSARHPCSVRRTSTLARDRISGPAPARLRVGFDRDRAPQVHIRVGQFRVIRRGS